MLVQGELPTDVPGLGDWVRRRAAFHKLTAQLQFRPGAGGRRAQLGKETYLLGDEVPRLLIQAGVRHKTLAYSGLQVERRRTMGGHTYFLANWRAQPVSTWVPLATAAKSVALASLRPCSGLW
ncbi:MAG: hypothetical protein EOO55_00670 [Hymenobacter sp.]|nr:MAG: hypothetical protein EOO55_00670 [Hymenobacter sp.]